MEKEKKKSTHKCCVKNCKNKISGQVKYYNFPRSAHKIQQREKWIAWTRKVNGDNSWEPSTYTYICSTHFVGNETSCSFLSPSYVPSIHHRKSDEIDAEERRKIKRFQRIVKRKLQRFEWSKEVAKKLVSVPKIPEPGPLFVQVEEPSIKQELILNEDDVNEENSKTENESQKDRNKNLTILESLLLQKKKIKTEDKAMQACVFEATKKHFFGTQTVFSCHQQQIDNICHAATQVITPDDIGKVLIPTRRRNFRDKCCGTE